MLSTRLCLIAFSHVGLARKGQGQKMDRWYRHILARGCHLSNLGMLPCLSVLFCLFILAIQLAIPVAQIWHIAAEHIPAVTSSEQHQSDHPEASRIQFASHRGDALDDPIYCLVCQAFVYLHNVVDIQAQVATDIERSICPLPLTRLTVCQTFLHASAPRAPPVFS